MNKKLRKRSSTLPQPRSTAPATPANTDKMPSTLKRKCKRSSGRLGKRKPRKTQIKGLDAIDFLHNKTLLSTSSEVIGEKLSPPPGCVDYQFTSLTAIAADTVPIHSELPPATSDTSYALQVLLNLYKEQLQIMVKHMKSTEFKETLDQQIVKEKVNNVKLSLRLEQLQRQVNSLIEDSVCSLKARMSELGIDNGFGANDLMLKAKEIMFTHHELQGETMILQNEIPQLESQNAELLEKCAHQAAQVDTIQREDERYLPVTVSERINGTVSNTPFSIVLPTYAGSAQGGQVLTPAAKKMAYFQWQEENMKTDSPVYHNENNPPMERIYENGHHHKSSKKSRKTRRKSHKQVETQHTNIDSSRRKYAASDEMDTRIGDHLQISVPNILQDPPRYSEMSSTTSGTVPVFRDTFEDIITSTLSEDNSSFYTSERVPDIWTCKKEEINSNTDLMNKNQTGCENDDTCDNFKADQSDYRKVPPLKIALKRHLSRESKACRSTRPNMMETTVGDLVNNEIERSLEISNHRVNNVAPPPSPFHSPNTSLASQYDAMETHSRKHSKKSDKTRHHVNDEFTSAPDLFTNFEIMVPTVEVNGCRNPGFKSIKDEPLENSSKRFEVSLTSFSMSSSRTPSWDSDVHPCSLRHERKPESNVDLGYYSRPSVLKSPSKDQYQYASSDLNENTGNKWQEVSLGFDRIVEFVSTKLDTEESFSEKRSTAGSSTRGLSMFSPPKRNSKPPPLHRADSPSEYDGIFERRSSLRSSIAPALPYSPAPLEGPFSPVSPFSPPLLQSDFSVTIPDLAVSHEVNEKYCFNEKFRPKGKNLKWR